jgi:hypothetical protein
MATTKLRTDEMRVHTARQLIQSINSASSTYYMTLGDPTTGTPTAVNNDVQDTTVSFYRNMVLGKQIAPSDVSLLIRKVNYTSNTVYARYDDADPFLSTKDYYVTVDAGSYNHVFKCLDNNGGRPSTVAPDFADVDPNDAFYQTSDGYQWRYLYSVDSTTVAKFSTVSTYFPVVPNTTITNAAVSGAIDVIAVDVAGSKYNNYLHGTFALEDLRVNGNTTLYSVAGSSNTASAVNGYYTGCLLYLATGSGAGQYRTVSDYVSNSSGKFIAVDSEFATNPTNGNDWEIYPYVQVQGDGYQTVNVVARAIVNAVGNTVQRVEILERGAGYTYAIANVIANTVVGVTTPAVVRPIYSPPGGHGFDVVTELGATAIAVTTKIANTEGNTVPATNTFRQIGLIRDPSFANVVVSLSNTAGSFSIGETVKQIDILRMKSNVAVTANSNLISNTSGFFTEQFTAGDSVYLVNLEGDRQLLTAVNAVVNNTTLNLTSTLSWACSSAVLYKATVGTQGTLTGVLSGSTIVLSPLHGSITGGDLLVGTTSAAKATVNTVSRNAVTKTFQTFVQMFKYVGSYDSGLFLADEVVYQGPSLAGATATGLLHSTNTSTLYVSNQVGVFTTDTKLKGANSGAVFSITTGYSPEVVFGSGETLYVENINPVTRSNVESDNINIVFKF